MPEITIIISCHEDRGFLDEAIQSALKQTFKDYNVILSIDGNFELIKYAKKYNIDYILHPKSNYTTCFNTTCKLIKSDWIKGLHDDDMLTENCLQSLYNSKQDCDLVYANAYEFEGSESYPYYSPNNVELNDFLPIITNRVHGGTLLINRDIFLKVGGFDTHLRQTEDYELYLNLLSHGYKMSYCNEIVTNFRLHTGQMSNNNREIEQGNEKKYLLTKYPKLCNVKDAY